MLFVVLLLGAMMRRQHPRGGTEPLVCFGEAGCAPLSTAVHNLSSVSSWTELVPSRSHGMHSRHWVCGPPEEFCSLPAVREALRPSEKHPGERFELWAAVDRIEYLTGNLDFQSSQTESRHSQLLAANPTEEVDARHHSRVRRYRLGWVPALLPETIAFPRGWRLWHERNDSGRPSALPCGQSRGEDAAVIRSFFSDFETREPLRGGQFLEIGGFNGFIESTTLILEG
eukprot:scaffold128712_cov24-Tisochrysis_lutea.AAC.1